MGSLTDVSGIFVGHVTDAEGLTGVTAVVCPEGAVVAADIRGGAPGTRETDLCQPGGLVERAQAVLLCGGSAFGLAAAQGAVAYLAEQGWGFPTSARPVPIVPAAVLYDLDVGDASAYPTAEMGYQACAAAIGSDAAVAEGGVPGARRGRTGAPGNGMAGNIGAGTGCSVGKFLGIERAVKSGLAAQALGVGGRWTVAALAAVNAAGEVHHQGRIVAGIRDLRNGGFVPARRALLGKGTEVTAGLGQATTLAVVATDAALSPVQAHWLARMAQDGLPRAIDPVHTPYDGDSVFALATGRVATAVDAAALTRLGAAAAWCVAAAIIAAVRAAEPAGDLPSTGSWLRMSLPQRRTLS